MPNDDTFAPTEVSQLSHHCEMDPTNEPRIWICPISSYRFEVDVDVDSSEVKVDKYGNKTTDFKITPLDGTGG